MRLSLTNRQTGAIAVGLVVLLSLGLFFFNLGSYGLWEPDEGRYAEVAREMTATRSFIVPHLNYVIYAEKPPLLYWLTVLSFAVCGLNEFAARLVGALAALAAVAVTSIFTLKLFDLRRAVLAGAILATAPLYAVMAQVLTTDMLLCAFMAAATFTLFLQWHEGGRWCWIAYLMMAMAVLTKGPVGAMLPLLIMALFLWREGELRGALSRLSLIPGLLLVAAITAPWFVAMTLRVPGFFSFYFIGEHLRRFLEPNYSHEQPIYFYIPVIAAGLLPWSLLAPILRWRQASPNAARRFCVIAAAAVFLFFSLAHAKLIPYVLPVFAPLAVLIADGIVCSLESEGSNHSGMGSTARRLAIIGPLLSILGAIATALAFEALHLHNPYLEAARPELYVLGAIAMTGGVVTFVCFRTMRTGLALTLLVATVSAALIGGSYARLAAEPIRSYARLSRVVASQAPQARLVCYRRYVQALPFYCQRRVILVGGRTELSFGAALSPDANSYFFDGAKSLFRLWQLPGPIVVVLDRDDLEHLKSGLAGFRVIASEGKKRAIVRTTRTDRSN